MIHLYCQMYLLFPVKLQTYQSLDFTLSLDLRWPLYNLILQEENWVKVFIWDGFAERLEITFM